MNFGIVLTALSGILYGSIGYFGNTLLAHGLTVTELLFWRFFCSSLFLCAYLPIVFKEKPSREILKALFFLFCLGGLFYGGSTALYFEATKTAGTGLAMVLFYCYPISVVLLTMLVNKTPLSKITFASLVLIIVGCVMIAYEMDLTFDYVGIVFSLASGIAYGLYVFWSKKVTSTVSSGSGAFVVCLGNTVVFFIATLFQDSFYVPTTTEVWTCIGLFSFTATVLPVFFMLAGMRYISANKASIISVLEPVTTLVVGALVLNEAITPLQLIGAVTILSSAILIQIEKEEPVSQGSYRTEER